MSEDNFPFYLLRYPMQLVDAAVRILAIHPGEIRERLVACRSELALLRGLELPVAARNVRDEIFACLHEADQNKRGIRGMRKTKASTVAALVLDLQYHLGASCQDVHI